MTPNDQVPPRAPMARIGNGERVEQPTEDEKIREGWAFLSFLLLCFVWVVTWAGGSLAVILAGWSTALTVAGLTALFAVFGVLTLATLVAAIRS